jgi:hypothetical protein
MEGTEPNLSFLPTQNKLVQKRTPACIKNERFEIISGREYIYKYMKYREITTTAQQLLFQQKIASW